MGALGATQAVNLDGGGSTTLVSGGQVVNVPSDATGERAIGDAVLLFAALARPATDGDGAERAAVLHAVHRRRSGCRAPRALLAARGACHPGPVPEQR